MGNELPKNWVESTLNEIANWGSGGTPKKGVSSYYGGNIPWIKTGDLNDDVVTEVSEYITEEGVTKSSAKIFPKGSVGLAMYGATIGRTGLFSFDAATNQACAVAQTYLGMNAFLHYLLKSEKKAFIDKGKGGAQPNISQTVIKAHSIKLPPLAEQQRIVAKLDSLFGHLEQVKTRLGKIPTVLKNFRQAILTQAVTGKLTEEWREGKELGSMTDFVKNLSKQREEEYQKAVTHAKANKLKKPKKDYEFEFEKHSTRNSWCIAKLENLIYMSARIGWKGLKADEYTQEGPLFLSVHGLNYGENVNYDVAYHITQERYDESPEIMLQEKDILLCKDGAGIGKLGIVKNLSVPATVNSSLLVVRGREALNYKYLYYFLAGPSLQSIAKERITGTAIPHLFQKDIKEFYLEIPSLEEQSEIVRRVESSFKSLDAIETKYKTLKAQIDSLPQAILAKAFKGELVEQLDTDGDARGLLKEIQKLKAEAVVSNKKGVKRRKPKSKVSNDKSIDRENPLYAILIGFENGLTKDDLYSKSKLSQHKFLIQLNKEVESNKIIKQGPKYHKK
jgi:type I restriction enzyme S subunit